MHTVNLTRQTTKNRGAYTKNRLSVPLPSKVPWKRYRAVLNDEGSSGIIYSRATTPSAILAAMIPISPFEIVTGILLNQLMKRHIEVVYLGVVGSLARGDYTPKTSDIDLLLIVRDQDRSKISDLQHALPEGMDLMVMSQSEAVERAGTGLERLALDEAQPILDQIGLRETVSRKSIDWKIVQTTLEAELDLLDSYEHNVLVLARTRQHGVEASYHLLLRLRAIHLVECLLRGLSPRKQLLYRALVPQGVSERLIVQMYKVSRNPRVMPSRRCHVPSRKDLLRVSDAIRRYGEEVKTQIAKKSISTSEN